MYHRTGEEEETADLVSRIFVKAMNAIGKYECRGLPFGAWLFKIAANETKKHFRGKKIQILCLEEEKLADLWSCGDVDTNEERIQIMEQLIDHLSEEEVTVLQLKFFEDKNFREIAIMLEKKESMVKMKMYRALKKLRVQFEKLDR